MQEKDQNELVAAARDLGTSTRGTSTRAEEGQKYSDDAVTDESSVNVPSSCALAKNLLKTPALSTCANARGSPVLSPVMFPGLRAMSGYVIPGIRYPGSPRYIWRAA